MPSANWIKPLLFFFLAGWAGSFLYAASWSGYDYSPSDALKNYAYHEGQLQRRLAREIEVQKEMAVSADRIAETQRMLATSYAQLGDWPKAEAVFKDMIPKAEELETPAQKQQMSLAISELAGFYRDWGKFDRALLYYRRVFELDKNAPLLVARDLNNLGLLYLMWAESESSESKRESLFVKSANLFDGAYRWNNATENANASVRSDQDMIRDLNQTIRANFESLLSAAGADTLSPEAFVPNDFGS